MLEPDWIVVLLQPPLVAVNSAYPQSKKCFFLVLLLFEKTLITQVIKGVAMVAKQSTADA
ncbi:hypothetical protein CGZ75_19900 [Paenibacillus herberti]|uniref:Uncharacterized protein n=1 Tax=Paenibacillus herberti TaxID=1619309 RepID=A0A229NU44_9BACL|nr:hypothetical protein CGZ75_19900 [Paenibacillus herberti]